ncbi:uncharacterized protein [Palaemon carinicauda]|uniref:uncharacterized protein n=1 Tax=Palaemon carinicauda TaxID=392227 RepID=UPI0035B67EBB
MGFNWETLNGYLQRCWNIFKGTASVTDATKKTIVHLCASHFMNKVKKFCLLNYKRNIKFGMYMISLLMNARTMSEAEQILHDICVSLKNPTLNAVTKQSVERLMVKINNFDTSVADAETSVQTEGTPGDEKIVKSGSYTEEDYLLLGDKSPFKTWANQIAANTDTDSSDKEANPFFSLKYMEHILKFYLPLFPLWSALLLGDLTTFNPLYKMHKNSLILAKTTALSENRFRIIKNLHLDDRTQSRIDVFSHMLYEATTSAQIIAARDCLKAPSLIGKHQKNTYKKKTQLLQERWAKRKPQPANLKRTKGIFQSPPNDKFSLPATEKKQDSHRGKICTPVGDHSDTNSIQSCGMLNKGNTCWFNATIQALHASNISTRMLESTTKQSPVEVESCGKRRQAIDKEKNSILDILMFLKCERECKDQVPSQLVEQALKCVVDANPDAFTIEQQQDVHEFYTSIVQFMGEKKDREVLIRETRVCKKNGCNLEGLEHDLLLAFPDKSSKVRGRITLFQLMSQSQNFGSGKTVECNQCEEDASQSYKIVQLPNTVIILLKRFRFENGRSSKVMDKIEIDQVLNLSQFCDTNISSNMSYHLKSVVCHHGASLATGHYTTFVLDKTKQHFIEYDDLNVSTRPLNDSRLASGSYVFMYDRVPAKIPAIIRPMLKCLSYTGGLQQASTENFGQARSMSLKKQMLKSIASGHIDNHTLEALESGLGTISCSYRSCIELIEAVDTFLFKQDENSVSVGIECFESVCEKIWKCRNCQRRKHKSSQLLILEVDRLTVSTCVDALQKVGPSDFPQRCNCQSDNFQVFVSALPKTLLVHVKDCTSLMTGDFYVPEISTLNIQSSVICALPLLGGTYTAVSALAFDSGGACSLLKKVGGRLEKQSDSSTGNAVSLQSCSEVLLFYDKQPSTVVYVLPSYCSLDFSQLESLSLGSLDEVTLQRRKFKQTVIQNMVIDQRMINSLTKPQNWLTSKEINAYMHLLCNLSIGKIHSVDSGWFSQKLLSGNFTKIVVYGSESRHLSWARFDFVLIPINEDENRHWTMCVVDMKNKIVYYSNSLTTENRDLVFQLFRYLAYEVLVHEGEIIKFSDWRCCFFSSNKAFQKQNDGSSCGVFVCATAKAIVLRKKLPVHPEFATLYRYKMAVELMKGCIEEE